MKKLIKFMREEKDTSDRLSFAIGYMKGYKEYYIEKKFTIEEVLDLLENIREIKEN